MLSKNEFRQFKTELDFIIKEHDPSTIKIIGRLAALDSPKEQLEEIRQAVEELVDLRPEKIIERFDLQRPIYSQTASYGHFGRTDIDLPWERTDLAKDLKKHIVH